MVSWPLLAVLSLLPILQVSHLQENARPALDSTGCIPEIRESRPIHMLHLKIPSSLLDEFFERLVMVSCVIAVRELYGDTSPKLHATRKLSLTAYKTMLPCARGVRMNIAR